VTQKDRENRAENAPPQTPTASESALAKDSASARKRLQRPPAPEAPPKTPTAPESAAKGLFYETYKAALQTSQRLFKPRIDL